MSLESTGSRCEQIARQMQLFGRIIDTSETVAKIDAVDEAAMIRAAETLFRARPTLATIGPVGAIPSFDAISQRLVA